MTDVRVVTTEDAITGETEVRSITVFTFSGTVTSTGGTVSSVNGHTGAVVLDADDVGAATEAQGALADSATQPGDLATVATTGAYSDLTGKPSLGTAAAQNTGDFDAAGAAASAQAAAVATSEAYTDAAIDGIGGGTGTVTSVNTVEPVAGDVTLTPADIGAATSAQGALADSATQPGDLGTAAAADTGDFDAAGAASSALTTAEAYTDGAVSGLVPNTRTVAGHALSANVTVSKSDVGLGSADNTADAAKAVLSATKLTTARAINGVSFDGSADITVADGTKVPTTRTVGGHALSADVTLVKGDVGLGNVDNTADSAKTFTESQVTGLVTDLAAKVPKSLFDANTILAADTDDTPAALTVAASRIVGRKATGGIAALTVVELKALLAYVVADISDAQPLDSDLTTIAGLTATTDNFLQSKSSAWASRTPAQVAADLALPVAAVGRSINTQTGTTYTLVLTDGGKFVTMNNASASTLTVPPNSSVAFPTGTFVEGVQLGAGQVTLTAGAGVTIRNTPGLKIAAQYGTFGLLKIGTDEWVAMGRLSA